MEEYKLELKQIVDYPRCRMYRQFILNLIGNKVCESMEIAISIITPYYPATLISEHLITELSVSHIHSIPVSGSVNLMRS